MDIRKFRGHSEKRKPAKQRKNSYSKQNSSAYAKVPGIGRKREWERGVKKNTPVTRLSIVLMEKKNVLMGLF